MQGSNCAQRAMALAAAGRGQDALALLDRHAADEDAEALLLLGFWRLEGRLLPRDVSIACALFGRAGNRGHQGAARIHAGLLANGAGGVADWQGALGQLDRWSARDPLAARQLALISEMALTPQGDPATIPELEILCDAPGIARITGLFSPAECAFLVALAEHRFKPALIFHEGQQRFVRDPIRDSDAVGFPLVYEWPFVHALNRRIAAASGTAVAQGEPLQLLRYGEGQQYRPHLDAIPGMANQRILTLLVSLNADYDGGETQFFRPGLGIRGRTGDALLFRNTLADGRPDEAAMHAGQPVTRGTKLIASRWIRARPPDAPHEGFGPHEAADAR